MSETILPFYRVFQVPRGELDRIASAHVREAHKIGFESCIAHSDHCSMCWLIATLERVAVEYGCPPHHYVIEDVGEYVLTAACEDCDEGVQVSPKRSRNYKVGEWL